MFEFNFDTRKTAVARSLRAWSFPLIKYGKALAYAFFLLFILSLLALGYFFASALIEGETPRSFLNILWRLGLLAVPAIFLAATLVFWEIYLFGKLKLRNPKLPGTISQAIEGKGNLAEFLTLKGCELVHEAIKIAKRRRLPSVGSEALLFSCLSKSKDIQMLVMRLGVDLKKMQLDLKNNIEKQSRQKKFNLLLDESFQKTMQKAAVVANARGHEAIGVKEILVGLASHDEFFKNVLIEYDLKALDVENITMWLDSLESVIEKRKQFWTKENLSRFGSLGKDWSTGFTVTLDSYAIDWHDIAKDSLFNEIIGHKKEVEELERALAKTHLSNALIVGDAGVGRKSIVQALAQNCFLGTSLPELNDKRVVELDMVALLSRIQDPEVLESTLDQIFAEALSAGNVVLVIDNFDHFIEEKIPKPGMVDISGIIGKYLMAPNFQFVGITSFDGLHRKLEQNPALLEYFKKIEVGEITEAETIRILQNAALGLEQRYKMLIVFPAIREIVNLTARYFPSTPFPKKAIDVLEEAVVYVRNIKEKVVLPHHIAKIISDKAQIPVGKIEFKEKSVLLNLENLIHQRIVGQEEAINQIAIAMRRARAGISSKKRPMGTFLFLGPTGVGKTETAKALAEIYFNGEDKMIRLDMSEFQSISDIPRLLGAVSPVEQQGLLTTPVRENPFSLVLLDEIEKAHPDILNLLLQVLDEGHITDGQGRKVVFTNTIIICTSNAGAAQIFKAVDIGAKIEKDGLFSVLFEAGTFKPEFINRFDAAVLFNPLTKGNLLDIAQLSLASLQKNLKEKEINLTITEPLKEKIVELSYKPEFGAREMRRVMQDKVENKVAEALLSDKITKGDTIEINSENFEVVKI